MSRPPTDNNVATNSREPVSYGSLSDLNKGRSKPPPPPYNPPASYQSSSSSGRRVPPPPSNYGAGAPAPPPRRTVPEALPTSATPSRLQSAQNTAAGYIPSSVSATATSVGDRMKDGFDSVVNQQTKEKVVSGAGKAAAGAAKLAGKAAWSLGKFATGSK